MTPEELNNLMKQISPNKEQKKDEFDYSGYGVIENMELSKEDLRKALYIMWDIVMKMSSDERDSKYLFKNGVIKSKEVFSQRMDAIKNGNQPESASFIEAKEIFESKLKSLRPLVEFLVKMKEIV